MEQTNQTTRKSRLCLGGQTFSKIQGKAREFTAEEIAEMRDYYRRQTKPSNTMSMSGEKLDKLLHTVFGQSEPVLDERTK